MSPISFAASGPMAIPVGGAVGTLAVDGLAYGSWSSGTTFTLTPLTSSHSNCVILLCGAANAAAISSFSGAGISGVAQRTQGGVGNNVYQHYGVASAPLSSVTITVTISTSGAAYAAAIAMAVSGCDVSSIPTSAYDINGSLPFTASSGTATISTTKPSCLLLSMCRGNGDGSVPTNGGTWTDAVAAAGSSRGALFIGFSYLIVPSAQSSLVLNDTMTSVNGVIGDALMASGQ